MHKALVSHLYCLCLPIIANLEFKMSYPSFSLPMKAFQLTTLSLALALAGCGGDGTDTVAPVPDLGVSQSTDLVPVVPDTSDPSEGGGEEESTIEASEIYILSNYSSINVNMAKDTTIKVEALVLDNKNGVINNKTVTFEISDPKATGLFSTSSSRVTTDEKGKAVIELQATNKLTDEQKDFLLNNGLTIKASVDGVEQSITLLGKESNTNTQKDDVYDVYISSDKTELLTGTDAATVNIRVTDKRGGVVAGVPVIIGITDAALYGLSLSSPSKQITDEQGLIAVELVQSRVSTDAQLNHESLLTVVVDDEENSIVEQSFPIIVSGTRVSNANSSKNIVSNGENFTVSGQILDGASNPINRAEVVLYNNNVEAGTGSTDSNGNFRFDLNAATLTTSSEDSYVFSIEIKGTNNTQNIPNILTVGSAISSSMNFGQVNDLEVGKRDKVVTLNVPDGMNGDSVVVTTNKGKIYKTMGEAEAEGSSRRILTVMNKKVEFFIASNVPDSATITATHRRVGQQNTTKQTVLNFVSVSPTKLLLQTERSVLSTGGSTEVIARVLDDNDAPVKNAIVQFTTIKDASGGSLSQAVKYTDASGLAKVTYNAGQNPTQTNGVIIEAEVKFIQLPNNTEDQVNPSISSTTELSVQTKSTFISFAFADKISAGDREVYYFQKGSISVLNSTGKPAINQPVSINLNPIAYTKGEFYVAIDEVGDKVWDRRAKLLFPIVNPPLPPVEYGAPISCDNEDTNNNGILDLGEDVNGNGQLDPINVAAVLDKDGNEVSSTQNFNFVTDGAGKVDFSIRYPKEYADWYRAKVTVNTSVDGSESQQSRSIGFPTLINDVNVNTPIRPNWISPFGIQQTCFNDK